MLKRSPSPGVLWVSLAAQLCVLLLLLATLTATDVAGFMAIAAVVINAIGIALTGVAVFVSLAALSRWVLGSWHESETH